MFFACPFDNKDIVRYFAYLFYFRNQSSNFYVIKYAYVMTCIMIFFVCFFVITLDFLADCLVLMKCNALNFPQV